MVDLIIIIVMMLFIAMGYRKGLAKSIVTFASSIIALILTFIVYPVVREIIIKMTTLSDIIYKGTLDKVQEIDFGRGLQTQAKAITENITWLPRVLTEQIANNNNTGMYEALGVTTIQEYVSSFITYMIISLIAILLTWLIIKIGLAVVLGVMVDIIEYLPIISTCNYIGGGILGGLKGLLTLSIIMLIVPMLMTNPNLSELGELVESSYLAQWIYKHNLVIWFYNYLI